MNDMKKEEKSLSLSTIQYDMGGDTLQSRKRHGWAPAKEDYQDEISNQRPVSYPGASINQIYNVILNIYDNIMRIRFNCMNDNCMAYVRETYNLRYNS